MRVRFPPGGSVERAILRLGEATWSEETSGGEHVFEGVRLPAGPGRLEVLLEDGSGTVGAFQVFVERT